MLAGMTIGSNKLIFMHDENGSPYGFTYNGTAYYYIKNLQGDVEAIANASGTIVVRYYYDAWGNILDVSGTLADTIGEINPIRYRSYYYDTETGYYYLNSRYYSPDLCRFISADNQLDTGNVLGMNLFSYCGNNPVNRKDPTGHFWQELWDAFTEALEQAAGYFAVAAGVTQADTFLPGPADVLGVGIAVATLLVCVGNAINSVNSESANAITESAVETVPFASNQELTKTAEQYGIGKCKQAAYAMQQKNNGRGKIVQLYFPNAYNGYVVSDRYPYAISSNGVHYGYLYEGIVRCNIYPEGRPFDMWVSSFADASGQPPIVILY